MKLLDKMIGNQYAVEPKRTQLYFYDDGSFEFRKLPIQYTFMVELKEKAILRGWKHYYCAQYPFDGFAGIQPDMVLLGFSRDVVLDPHNLVPEKDKPDKRKPLNENNWLRDIAMSARYRAKVTPFKERWAEMLTLILGGCTLMVVFAMILKGCGNG